MRADEKPWHRTAVPDDLDHENRTPLGAMSTALCLAGNPTCFRRDDHWRRAMSVLSRLGEIGWRLEPPR